MAFRNERYDVEYVPSARVEWQPYNVDFERAQLSGKAVSIKMDAETTIHFVPSKKRLKRSVDNAASSMPPPPLPVQQKRRRRHQPIRPGLPTATATAAAASTSAHNGVYNSVMEKMQRIYENLDEARYQNYVANLLDEIESDAFTMNADEKRRIIELNDKIQQRWNRFIAVKNAAANATLARQLKETVSIVVYDPTRRLATFLRTCCKKPHKNTTTGNRVVKKLSSMYAYKIGTDAQTQSQNSYFLFFRQSFLRANYDTVMKKWMKNANPIFEKKICKRVLGGDS
jgi:hypothetical protein